MFSIVCRRMSEPIWRSSSKCGSSATRAARPPTKRFVACCTAEGMLAGTCWLYSSKPMYFGVWLILCGMSRQAFAASGYEQAVPLFSRQAYPVCFTGSEDALRVGGARQGLNPGRMVEDPCDQNRLPANRFFFCQLRDQI